MGQWPILELDAFPGIKHGLIETLDSPVLCVVSEYPLKTLNSSIWGGGFSSSRFIMNRQVPKSYMSDDPAEEMQQFLQRAGYPADESVGMLTAAWVDHAGRCLMTLEELSVCSWVTVGLGNTARSGDCADTDRLYPGTINCIVLVDGQLSDAAMVNAVITVTEAKTALLQDLVITVGTDGRLATGTTTDAVVIAATDRGRSYSYAGTATRLGYLIGRTVYDAGKQAALDYLEVMRQRAAAK